MEHSPEVSKDAIWDSHKYPKSAVDYGLSSAPLAHACGICDHFLNPNRCQLVRGNIRVLDSCKLFTPEIIPCEAK